MLSDSGLPDISHSNRAHFFQHIQQPTSRIKDRALLAFHAQRFYEENPGDAIVRAGALTILTYRNLDKSWADQGATEFCLEGAASTLSDLGKLSSITAYRWLLSLTLAIHYLRITEDIPADVETLAFVHAKRELVQKSPAQATNSLKLTFHLGTALWKQNRKADAEHVFLSAKDTIRSAASVWWFENYYSSIEFVQAASLVRACLMRLELLHYQETQKWRDMSFSRGPAKDGSDFMCLGSPAYRLYKEDRC